MTVYNLFTRNVEDKLMNFYVDYSNLRIFCMAGVAVESIVGLAIGVTELAVGIIFGLGGLILYTKRCLNFTFKELEGCSSLMHIMDCFYKKLNIMAISNKKLGRGEFTGDWFCYREPCHPRGVVFSILSDYDLNFYDAKKSLINPVLVVSDCVSYKIRGNKIVFLLFDGIEEKLSVYDLKKPQNPPKEYKVSDPENYQFGKFDIFEDKIVYKLALSYSRRVVKEIKQNRELLEKDPDPDQREHLEKEICIARRSLIERKSAIDLDDQFEIDDSLYFHSLTSEDAPPPIPIPNIKSFGVSDNGKLFYLTENGEFCDISKEGCIVVRP